MLGESYSPGWRAWCRDRAGHERALGAALPIDGFANGWRIGATCVSARMAFAPQSTVNAIYVLSAVAIVVLIALALGVRLPQRVRMRDAPGTVGARARAGPAGPAAVPPARRAADQARGCARRSRGVSASAPSPAFVFAVRFGVVAGPLTSSCCSPGSASGGWSGCRCSACSRSSCCTSFRPAQNYGGFSFYFSLHQILAHWIGAGVRVRAHRGRRPSGAASYAGTAPTPDTAGMAPGGRRLKAPNAGTRADKIARVMAGRTGPTAREGGP